MPSSQQLLDDDIKSKRDRVIAAMERWGTNISFDPSEASEVAAILLQWRDQLRSREVTIEKKLSELAGLKAARDDEKSILRLGFAIRRSDWERSANKPLLLDNVIANLSEQAHKKFIEQP